MLTFRFTDADGCMVVNETLTSGMVGKEVRLEFSSDWDDLTKTAVFMAGSVTRDVVGVSDVVTIPAEVLAVPMNRLYVGVYGVSADGKVTPTIRAQGPKIEPGADPSGDEGTDPELPVWAQLDQRLTKMEGNDSSDSGQNAVLYTAQELTDQQKAQARENIGAAAVTPTIVGASVGEKAMEFSRLMHGKDKVESFIFFTDPHFLNAINNEVQMREYLDTLKLYYDATPTSFVIGGGDWYGNSDTYETACFKLGYIDGWMRRLFSDQYYPAVGNHDTNQQGKDETGGTWTGLLPKETVRNLWFREKGSNYYSFDGANTKFYVLDTWKEGADAAYYWEQIAWLGEKLKTDNAENVALVLHIGYGVSGDSYAINTLATNAFAMCKAFNDAVSILLNGTIYNFAGCTGKVRFALSGHIHADHATIVNGIPLIATTHMRDGNTPTFDLCLADYSANTLHLVRVGAGESRQFTMGPDGAILDGTEDDTPEDTGLPVTVTVADPIVFLAQCNHSGAGINYYDKPTRSLIVTTENTGAVFAVSTGSTDTTHYALVLPDGATSVTVNCGDELKWSVDFVNASGVRVGSSDDWRVNGATDTGPAQFSKYYYYLKFCKADGSAFTEDYDVSGISWTFA